MSGLCEPEWTLRRGDYTATISAVGASVRELTFRGRPLVVGWDPAQLRPVYRGALVAPWPNRIADGRYSFGGNDFQVPLNEIAYSNALHGFTTWAQWNELASSAHALELSYRVVPQDGYPFEVGLLARFELTDSGLVTTLTARNTGSTDAPYGCCPHPYLVAGSSPLDTWSLSLPFATRLEVDDRLLPTHRSPVADIDNDFTTGAVIGDRPIDHAFTDGTAGPDGRTTVVVTDEANGTGTFLSFGDWADWIQIHTADRPEPDWNRAGLAVEPMTCPPDAFNGPDEAVTLAAGATHVAEWTIGATEA